MPNPANPVLLYDGVCGLCNRLVRFVLRRDRRAHFRFAPLQSEYAARILISHRLDPQDLNTLYVVEERERLRTRADAVIFILQELGGFWRVAAAALRILPKALRDCGYNVAARHRYRIFGRHKTCLLPEKEIPGQISGCVIQVSLPPARISASSWDLQPGAIGYEAFHAKRTRVYNSANLRAFRPPPTRDRGGIFFMQPATEKEDPRRNQASDNATGSAGCAPAGGGKLIVLTAPLTESIDHAGYFIQMALASIPQWLEFVLNKKYPKWREVERNEDGSARYMPAGVRVLEKSLLREYAADDVVACFPEDLDKFIGPNTRVVAVSTHNPLGVTFAAGVYTSIYGSSKEPLNSIYSRVMFDKIRSSPYRKNFQVVVGGSGGWQITQTNAFEELGVDCVAEGRSESADTLALFQKAIAGRNAAAKNQSGSPHLARRHPLSRQAHYVRRGGDDYRVRPQVPVLRARLESAD